MNSFPVQSFFSATPTKSRLIAQFRGVKVLYYYPLPRRQVQLNEQGSERLPFLFYAAKSTVIFWELSLDGTNELFPSRLYQIIIAQSTNIKGIRGLKYDHLNGEIK